MKIHPSLILAAALLFPGGNSLIAQTVSSPVDALAQKLQTDSKERAEAGKRLEDFLLKPDSDGKSFVSDTADQAALGALAQEWGRKANAGRLAALLVISTPEMKTEARLRMALTRWTGAAQIKKTSGKDAATAFFEDAAAQAEKLWVDKDVRGEIEASILANDQTSPLVPERVREGTKRAEKVRAQGAGRADIFGPARAAQDIPQGLIPGAAAVPAATPGPGAAPGSGPDAAIGSGAQGSETTAQRADRLNAEGPGTRTGPKLSSSAKVPEPEQFQALGSATWPPEPGVLDKAASYTKSDAKIIAEDFRTIRSSLQDAVPTKVQGNTDSNPDAVNQFFQWLRTAKESDMPAINYTTLPKGEVGHYELGLLGKGDIKVNHFVRDEPARARATVVVHELYHYWDKKIARNAYPNVSYGMIGAGTHHIHEYDAYLATSLYWEMVKNEGDASPLAKMLDGIPTDPAEVRGVVDSKVGGRK